MGYKYLCFAIPFNKKSRTSNNTYLENGHGFQINVMPFNYF